MTTLEKINDLIGSYGIKDLDYNKEKVVITMDCGAVLTYFRTWSQEIDIDIDLRSCGGVMNTLFSGIIRYSYENEDLFLDLMDEDR